jgi:hypothetical protein
MNYTAADIQLTKIIAPCDQPKSIKAAALSAL